jgi:hypothetical protein
MAIAESPSLHRSSTVADDANAGQVRAAKIG